MAGGCEASWRRLAHHDWRERRTAAVTLGAGDGDGAEERLARLLSSENAGERNAAVKALVRRGAGAVIPLARALESPDADVRGFAALALGLIGDAEAAAALLGRWRREDDANVRFLLMEGLGRTGRPEVLPVLLAVLDEGPWLAAPAVSALGELGSRRAVPALVALLGDEMLGALAVSALRRLPDPRAFGPLLHVAVGVPALSEEALSAAAAIVEGQPRAAAFLAAVRDRLPEAVREGLAALLARTYAEEPRHATLARWLRGEAGFVREEAAPPPHGGRDGEARMPAPSASEWTAGSVGLDELRFLASDPEPAVRLAAARMLGTVEADTAIPLLSRLVEDEETDVRAAAAAGLASLGTPVARALMPAVLEDPEPVVVREALSALHRIGRPVGGLRLDRLLGHDDRGVREAALRCKADLDPPTASSALADVARSEHAAAFEACILLAESGDPRSLATLRSLSSSDDVEMRWRAALALTSVTLPGFPHPSPSGEPDEDVRLAITVAIEASQ